MYYVENIIYIYYPIYYINPWKENNMTDITKFKNVSLSKKTYMDVGTLSKAIFDVPLSLSKTIEYLVEKEMKKVKKVNGNGKER